MCSGGVGTCLRDCEVSTLNHLTIRLCGYIQTWVLVGRGICLWDCEVRTLNHLTMTFCGYI